MKSRRWFVATVPALGLFCLILGVSAMQAQVATQPKAGDKARPAERAEPSEERATPAEAGKADPNTKGGAARRASADEPAGRDARDRDARRSRNADGEAREGGGWLGVYVAEPDETKADAGVQISQVFPASPAARAGFRGGDVITQVNDKKVADPDSFITVIESMPPGTKAAFAVQRNNQAFKLTATLGQNYWVSREQDYDSRDFEGSAGRGRGNQEEEYPIHALSLEHDRRMAEQHERMEKMLFELKEEVRLLREELKSRK